MQHTHTYHELYFSLSSGGTQYANDKEYELRPDQLFILPAGVGHLCTAWKSAYPVDAFVVFIDDSVFAEKKFGDADTFTLLTYLIESGNQGRHEVPLDKTTAERIRYILARLCQEREEVPGYAAALKAGLQTMFLALMRDPFHHKHFARNVIAPKERFSRVFDFLQNHFPEPVSVAEAAKIAGLSRSHFHVLFQSAAGMTFTAYVNKLRLEMACQLLRDTHRSITDIALSSGFDQLPHFYRCFRKHTGFPPGKYRALTAVKSES
jgi:AraC family transcriptional regulator